MSAVAWGALHFGSVREMGPDAMGRRNFVLGYLSGHQLFLFLRLHLIYPQMRIFVIFVTCPSEFVGCRVTPNRLKQLVRNKVRPQLGQIIFPSVTKFTTVPFIAWLRQLTTFFENPNSIRISFLL